MQEPSFQFLCQIRLLILSCAYSFEVINISLSVGQEKEEVLHNNPSA